MTSEDSILDGMLPGRITVTSSGDTLQDLGGGMIDQKYAVSEYRKNAINYFRIQEHKGNMADGRAIWRFITRVTASKLDSGEVLMYSGMCGTAAGQDPFMIAIALFKQEDTVFTAIRRAWRFDPSVESVKEISTSGVRCWNPGGD